MAKTKLLAFRIDEDLYQSVSVIAESFKQNISSFLIRLVNYAIQHPKEITNFDITDPVEREFFELDKMPKWSLHRLKRYGIISKGELRWIVAMIHRAWYRFDGTATAIWVTKFLKAFEIFLRLDLKNNRKLAEELSNNFPEEGKNLSEKMSRSFAFLNSIDRVETSYAKAIANCFLIAISRSDFPVPESVMAEIRDELQPWVFWVSIKALQKETIAPEIDITPLLNIQKQEGETFFIRKERTSVEVFLPSRFSSDQEGDGIFSCGFQITDGQKLKATIACISQTLYELVQAIANLQGKELAGYGNWTIQRNREGSCFVRKSGMQVQLEVAEIDEFMAIAKEIYENEQVKRAVIEEYVEKYGAL